jgi:aryl hydrocarbon receptor nuclear translocator-like protein 1
MQELLGTSLYEHVQYDDIPVIAECHRNTLKTPEEVQTPFFRFRTKEGKFVKLESKWKQFRYA